MLNTTMKNKWVRVLAAMVGAVFYALGVNLFLVPLDLYTGGIMGVCQLIRTLVYQAMGVTNGYDFSGILYYLFNVPIFLLAFRTLGRTFFVSSLLCTTIYTLTISVVPIPEQPLVGDFLYGTEEPERIPRPALHSHRLTFRHPITGQEMSFTAPVPPDMRRLMEQEGL